MTCSIYMYTLKKFKSNSWDVNLVRHHSREFHNNSFVCSKYGARYDNSGIRFTTRAQFRHHQARAQFFQFWLIFLFTLFPVPKRVSLNQQVMKRRMLFQFPFQIQPISFLYEYLLFLYKWQAQALFHLLF